MTGVSRVLPSKKTVSPAKFRPTPFQLPALDQLSSAPPPFQVLGPIGPLLTVRMAEEVVKEEFTPVTYRLYVPVSAVTRLLMVRLAVVAPEYLELSTISTPLL